MRYLSEHGVVALRGAHVGRQLSLLCFISLAYRDRRGDHAPPFFVVPGLTTDVARDEIGSGSWQAVVSYNDKLRRLRREMWS